MKILSMIVLFSVLITGCSSYSTGCFTGDTRISTPNGQVKITDIKPGDKVYAYDNASGKTVVGEVDKVFARESDRIGWMELENGGKIRITEDHPLYQPEKATYTEVGNLHAGDKISFLKEDGTTEQVAIKSLEYKENSEPVYNIKVKHYYNAFAEGILAKFYE